MRLFRLLVLYMIGMLCIPCFVCAQTGSEIKPPQPVLSISFERSSVEVGDTIRAVLQVSNSSAFTISGLRLEMDAPAFIQLSGASRQPSSYISFDSLPAYATLKNNQLFINVLRSARVGDFNLVFTLSYEWQQEKLKPNGQVTFEKPLKIGLFGTDKVVGIPLAFAQFIVPGLFFLFVLRMLKVMGAKDLEADEKIIVGVLVSAFCVFVVNAIGKDADAAWVRNFDLGDSISIEKLFVLALSGVILGLVFAGGFYLRKWWKEQQKKKLAFSDNDKDAVLIYKALKLNPRYEGVPLQVICKDGIIYKGSHYFKTEFNYLVVGGFRIDRDKLTDEQKKKIEKHCNDGKLIQSPRHILAVIEVLGGRDKAPVFTNQFVIKVENGAESNANRIFRIDEEEYRSKVNDQDPRMKLLVY